MKIITTLVLLQTGILLLLFAKVAGIEDEMTSPPAGESYARVADDPGDAQSQSYSNDSYWYPDEDRLRQIIREELRAELDVKSESDKQTDPDIVPGSRDAVEMEYHRAQVAQQLETYVSVGSISDVDMQRLQMDIARLDAAGRTEMLGELSRAFNSGILGGRL
jgi:hypothetical protein